MIFMRLPAGRKATYEYLRTLWDFPQPWIMRTDGGPEVRDQTAVNPQLPQFPAGTQFALLRQMMLYDDHGQLQPTPITESVQIRVYYSVAPHGRFVPENRQLLLSGQDFYEVVLSRPLLFTGKTGGLRATGRKERAFAILNSFGPDEGSPSQFVKLDNYAPALEECATCHSAAGINSVNSVRRLLRPNWLTHDYPDTSTGFTPPSNKWWEADQAVSWKQRRYEWGLLNGYWNAAAE
jgi:hypothetical protein